MTKLQKIRKDRGLTQKRVATLSKISYRTLQDYEIAHKSIDGAKVKTLLKLCKVLNCELVDILEDEESIKLLKK